jgi:hypothetical protein
MKALLLSILLPLIFCLTAYSQQDKAAVYLKKNASLDIDLVGDQLQITESFYSEKLFTKDFDSHSREKVYYSDLDPLKSFEAETILPRSKKVRVSTIETKDIVERGIFYGGHKLKDFVYPSLESGAIGKLSYSKTITDPHLLSPFYFTEYIDVKFSEFSVSSPSNVNINFKIFGRDRENIEYRKEIGSNKIRHVWTMRDIPAWQSEADAPARSYAAPHIVIFIDSYSIEGKSYTVVTNVSDLYKYYTSLMKQIPDDDEIYLNMLVTRITKDKRTDREKTAAIFQWVQEHIKYIAFEDGMAGFIPRSAADVCNKRYGDCKDMANLLTSMINAAGIKAYRTWIGSRRIPYSYDDVPSVIADNHMICTVELENEKIFLDATDSYLPFGRPTSMIQGKEALIGKTDTEFEIIKVPILPPKDNQRIDSIIVSIEAAGVRGSMFSKLTGYRKVDLDRADFVATLNQDNDYLRKFYEIGNNNLMIDNPVAQGMGSQNQEALVSFTFWQPGYYKKIGNKIYFNMSINRLLPGDKIELDKRSNSVERDYQYEDRVVSVLLVPPGYTVTLLPENRIKEWPAFGVRTSYKILDNKIYFDRTIYSNHLYLDSPSFAEWNEFIDELTLINSKTVVLTASTN